MQLRFLFALFALSVAVYAGRSSFRRGRDRGGLVIRRQKEELSRADRANTGEGTYTQKIDHFGTLNGTWSQRYFYNTQFGAGRNNILYIEGEGTASLYSLLGSTNPFVKYAEKYQANLYSLEHRFYGHSRPFGDISTASLKYLSSRQALADLADFVRFINAKQSQQQHWVVVGGSYSGSLALWLRQQYPDLISGALGSSGPVLAQVDFYGYLEVVENDVRKYDATLTAGHLKCADQIAAAFDKVIELMQSKEGRATLDAKFKPTPSLANTDPLPKNNIDYFYQGLFNEFMGAAQYGGLGSYLTVKQRCNEMTVSGKDPIDLLASIVPPSDISYADDVDYVKGTAWDDLDRTNERSWIWQTCTEFGYFQTTDKGSNIFRSVGPVNTYITMCADAFGVDLDTVKKSIDATNGFYGERNYFKGTNAIITHGTQDPWHYLTKQTTEHESVVVVEVPDGMHCSDFYDPCEFSFGCLDGVKKAQAITRNAFQRFFYPVENVPSNVTIADNVGKRPAIYNAFHNPALPVTSNGPTDAPPSSRKAESTAGNGKEEPNKPVKKPLGPINVFTGRHENGLLQPPPLDRTKALPNTTLNTIEQPWDHFDNSNPNTFKQQYWVNKNFGSNSGPNFLMIGGEGPESDAWVLNTELAWCKYAQKTGANLFLLEHRYYGKSKLGTNDLQYLTSAQQLYDVADFIKMAKTQFGVTGPWITFGGSYSGALSAWAREWFPELIAGAVGSSGPVEAKTDFYEYHKVVEKAMHDVSPQCVDKVSAAFDKIYQLTLSTEGRGTLTSKFMLQPSWTGKTSVKIEDVQSLISGIYVYFQTIAQYSGDNNGAGRVTVSGLCSIMQDGKYTDPLDAVVAVITYYSGVFFGINTSYQDSVDYYKNLLHSVDGSGSITDNELSGLLWTWQTCNEFGYYQSTDYGRGIFGSAVPVNYYVKLCEDVFGVSMKHVEAAIGRSIYQYGGRKHYKGSNVVLPNGSHDPWHALGLLDATGLDKTVVPILINGTAHCADMYAESAADSDSLKNARKTILNNIVHWVVNHNKQHTRSQ